MLFRSADFIPTLTSMLSPNHPLQSRKLALMAFCRGARGWFSSQMGISPDHRLDKLLQAVGDPFHFPPEPPQDGELDRTVYYEPMEAVVALIEFASSELWRTHLLSSSFASCEDLVSTDQGKRTALRKLFDVALGEGTELPCTPTKIVTAIRHLEGLRCVNTAQLVIMWAWVTGMANEMDQDGWRLIGDETLRFYRAHGMRSLAALKRWVAPSTDEVPVSVATRAHFFSARYEGPSPFRVGRSRRPSKMTRRTGLSSCPKWMVDCIISQTCQLRRLYHLCGCDPTTWQEAVGVEEVDGGRGALSRNSDPFVDWSCDYP